MEVLLAVWAMDPGRVGLARKVRSVSGNRAIPMRSYPGEADSAPKGHKTPEAMLVATCLNKGTGSVGGELSEGTVCVSVALAPNMASNV